MTNFAAEKFKFICCIVQHAANTVEISVAQVWVTDASWNFHLCGSLIIQALMTSLLCTSRPR